MKRETSWHFSHYKVTINRLEKLPMDHTWNVPRFMWLEAIFSNENSLLSTLKRWSWLFCYVFPLPLEHHRSLRVPHFHSRVRHHHRVLWFFMPDNYGKTFGEISQLFASLWVVSLIGFCMISQTASTYRKKSWHKPLKIEVKSHTNLNQSKVWKLCRQVGGDGLLLGPIITSFVNKISF